MQSVSPMSSTISSQEWRNTFVAAFETLADPNQRYRMRFEVVGEEWEPLVENGQIVGRKVNFNLSYKKLVDLGFNPSVGQILNVLALEMTEDGQFIEIWHA